MLSFEKRRLAIDFSDFSADNACFIVQRLHNENSDFGLRLTNNDDEEAEREMAQSVQPVCALKETQMLLSGKLFLVLAFKLPESSNPGGQKPNTFCT